MAKSKSGVRVDNIKTYPHPFTHSFYICTEKNDFPCIDNSLDISIYKNIFFLHIKYNQTFLYIEIFLNPKKDISINRNVHAIFHLWKKFPSIFQCVSPI